MLSIIDPSDARYLIMMRNLLLVRLHLAVLWDQATKQATKMSDNWERLQCRSPTVKKWGKVKSHIRTFRKEIGALTWKKTEGK